MSAPIETLASSNFKSKYFAKEIFALKLVGVSLTGDEGLAYKIYSFVSIIGIIGGYSVLDFFEIFKHDVDVASDIAVYTVSGFIVLVKIAAVIWNRVKVRNLLIKLERPPFLPNTERGGDIEEKLIQECVFVTTAQTLAYWVFTGIIAIASFIFILYKRVTSSDYHDWQFAYGPFTYLNVTYSPNYEISWFYQNLFVWYGAMGFTTIDVLIAAVLTHCCYQFRILQNYITGLVESSHAAMAKETSAPQKNQNFIYQIDGAAIPLKYLNITLKKAVNYHLAILEVAQEMEEVFSYPLLTVFLGALGQTCFSIYQGSKMGNSIRSLTHLGEGVIAIIQILLFCYWGEQMTNESERVGFAVYESNFVGTDLRFQRDLAFIIRRSQNTTRLTAGKFADIGLYTFAWFLRTAYSCFTILLRQNQN